MTPAILIKARHNGATLPADTACVAGSFRPVDDDDGQTLPEFITQTEDGFPGWPAAPATTVGGSSSTTRATGATVPSSTTSTVAGTTTSTELHARVVVTATTTAAIPNTGTDSGDMAVIGIICLLLGLSVLMPRLRNGRPWSIPPVR